MKKTLVKNITAIVSAIVVVIAWIYALVKWDIDFKTFSDTTIKQAEVIDDNLEWL